MKYNSTYDEMLYERLIAESSQYFYRNRSKFSDWQAVVIYPSQSVEQSSVYPHRSFLNGGQVHVVYLNKLGNIRSLPIYVALMVLTTLSEKVAPQEAKYLLERSRQESEASSDAILEIITSIMVYRFEQLSRKDIDTMLGITLKQTRVYQEAQEEGIAKVIFRLLKKRFGNSLSEEMRAQIESLPLATLENLSEALLDFNSLDDLQPWLEAQ